MAKGFQINERGMKDMERQLQRRVAKMSIKVPVTAVPADVASFGGGGATVVNNYHAPVVTVNGDNAQLAWNSESVNQSQTSEIAEGYSPLAAAVSELLASLEALGLGEDDAKAVQDESHAVLTEVTKAEPDAEVVKRKVVTLRGLLAPVLIGVSNAVTGESAETARDLLEKLTTALGS